MNKIWLKMLAGSSALVMATATYTQSASAQTSSTAAQLPTASTGDIIVTARRREESLQDVPQTIDVVTGNSLQKLSLKRFEDLQVVVPGLTLSSGNTGYSTVATIRGAAQFTESGSSPTVAFYLNDTLSSPNVLFQSIFDLGQIEVLRGPQGTLRGESAPSGAITVTTRRPDLNRVGGYVDLLGSEKGAINANAGFNLPIIEGVLAIRVAGLVDENDGNRVRSIDAGISPYSHNKAGRVSVRLDPSDTLSLNAMYQHLENHALSFDQVESFSLSNASQPTVQPIIEARNREGIGAYPRLNSQKQDIVTLNASWSFAGQRLVYAGAYNSFGFDAFQPVDPALKFPSVRLGQQVSTGATIWSHELRLSSESRIFNFLDYTVGAFHSLEPTTTTEVLPTPIALPSFLGGGLATVVNTNIFLNARTSEWSEFANVTAHIGRKTELTGGVRHINYDFITNLYLNSKLLLPVDKKSTPWVYSFSLSHRFSDDLLAYATTGSSWRGGPYQIGVFSAEQTPRIQQFTNLKDETSKSYEVGLKANFFDKKLRLNVAGFHQTFNNFIYYGPFVNYVNVTQTVTNGVVSEVATPGVFHFGSSVPAVINGVDLDLAYQITPRFNISAAFSYAKGHIKNGTVACNDLNGDGIPDVNPGNPTVAQIRAGAGGEDVAACRTNERLSRAPNWSLTVQSEASQPIAPDVDGFVRGLLSYYPKNPNDPDNPYDTVKAYGLLNMYLGIRSPGGAWEVSVFAKNIANTGRVLTRDDIPLSTAAQVLAPPTFRTTVGTNFPTSYVDVTYTQPREIGLNVRYAFGSR